MSHWRADYPFPVLVEKLRRERDPSRSPLFQVLFSYENFLGVDILGASQSVTELAGNHYTLLSPADVHALAQQVAPRLHRPPR